MITGLVQPIPLSQSQRLTLHSSPPPCKANVASLPCRSHTVLLCSCSVLRRRRDLLSDLQTGSERGRAFRNSTISAQFRDQIDFPLQPQHRLQTAQQLGNIRRGRGHLGRRAILIGRALAESRPPALVAAGFHRARRANGSSREDAPPRHDNTQYRVQLS